MNAVTKSLFSNLKMFAVVLLASVSVPQQVFAQRTPARIELAPLASGFKMPVHLAFAPGRAGVIYVVEEQGTVATLVGDTKDEKPFFDLKPLEDDDSFTVTLLALAFHPQFETNSKFFISYARKDKDTPGVTFKLSEFLVSAETGRANMESEREILKLKMTPGEYFGGGLAFGKDETLYVGLSDGGGSHDPKNFGQNTRDLLGSILRLNVNEGETYLPPLDNPFVMNDQGMREIFAFGFRNPWKVTVDRKTGDVWTGDRGEDTYEEVELVVPGGNYGWSIFEGKLCLRMRFDCQNEGLHLPDVMYGHRFGTAVTGGYVYRGKMYPELEGIYLYGDASSGTIWGLQLDGSKKAVQNDELLKTKFKISAFGEDSEGELYVADRQGGGVYRLEVPGAAKPKEAKLAVEVPDDLPATSGKAKVKEAVPEPGPLVPEAAEEPLKVPAKKAIRTVP